MYLIEEDLKTLSKWLNDEKDIALIRSVGKGRWQAFDNFEIKEQGRYCLFHKSSGPLPLLADDYEKPDKEISDPFEGWKEERAGADPTQPFFGAGHPAIFWLNVHLKSANIIGMSSFEWIGNRYAITGSPAPDAAKKWWGRLGRWVKKQSSKIPRYGPIDGNDKEIWAFGGALREIQSGVNRANNP